jgi:hypothetical protein
MKKLLVILMLAATPMIAVAKQNQVEESVVPNQTIENTKAYTGISYNRQDSNKVGVQKIVNDHSWFNINIQIIKKGALFQGKDVIVGEEE